MTAFNALRTLARSTRWQILYARSKEVSGIHLFNNTKDFTSLQIAFLQWLEIYSSLEMDLALKEKHISRKVIADDYRVDAYLYYREHHDKTKDTKNSEPQEGYEPPPDIPGVVFRQGA